VPSSLPYTLSSTSSRSGQPTILSGARFSSISNSSTSSCSFCSRFSPSPTST
jgi:hypothetical protein